MEVLQTSDSKYSSTSGSRFTALAAPDSENKTIAITDRTANLDEAACAILIDRFNFQGMSLYAPDYVAGCEVEFVGSASAWDMKDSTTKSCQSSRSVEEQISKLST